MDSKGSTGKYPGLSRSYLSIILNLSGLLIGGTSGRASESGPSYKAGKNRKATDRYCNSGIYRNSNTPKLPNELTLTRPDRRRLRPRNRKSKLTGKQSNKTNCLGGEAAPAILPFAFSASCVKMHLACLNPGARNLYWARPDTTIGVPLFRGFPTRDGTRVLPAASQATQRVLPAWGGGPPEGGIDARHHRRLRR